MLASWYPNGSKSDGFVVRRNLYGESVVYREVDLSAKQGWVRDGSGRVSPAANGDNSSWKPGQPVLMARQNRGGYDVLSNSEMRERARTFQATQFQNQARAEYEAQRAAQARAETTKDLMAKGMTRNDALNAQGIFTPCIR